MWRASLTILPPDCSHPTTTIEGERGALKRLSLKLAKLDSETLVDYQQPDLALAQLRSLVQGKLNLRNIGVEHFRQHLWQFGSNKLKHSVNSWTMRGLFASRLTHTWCSQRLGAPDECGSTVVLGAAENIYWNAIKHRVTGKINEHPLGDLRHTGVCSTHTRER